jgi:hypothetical protein
VCSEYPQHNTRQTQATDTVNIQRTRYSVLSILSHSKSSSNGALSANERNGKNWSQLRVAQLVCSGKVLLNAIVL